MKPQTIQTLLDKAVSDGAAPGLTAAVLRPDGVHQFAAGVRGAADPRPMTADSVFWIASCTKAITALAAGQLVARGLLTLDAPIGDRVPSLAAPKVLDGFDPDGKPRVRPASRPITLRDLLTHTSGLAYDFCSDDLTRYFAATGENLMSTPPTLVFDPGAGWQYGIGIDAAGWAIEAVTGQGLDAYFAEHILGPLGMGDTSFIPDTARSDRRAGMHVRGPDGAHIPVDPFPNAPQMWGGGGLTSTAPDYLKFLAAMITDGAGVAGPDTLALLRDIQAGQPATGDLISSNPGFSHDFLPMPGIEKHWTLGFLRNAADVPGGRRAGSLAWGGIANCYYWADPASGVAGVMFAQFLPFADPRMMATFEAFEQAVYAD
jgi:CubicO group peptidase (beta-lactamase class C family)